MHVKHLEHTETPYVYQEYPKWKYHAQLDPVIIADAVEEDALGGEWFDSPKAAADAVKKLQTKPQNKLKVFGPQEEVKT